MERPVFTSTRLRVVTAAVEAGRLYEKRPMDVPLRAIVGLGRGDVCEDGQSWRYVVEHVLHGDHGQWDERALAYFESEIGDQDFPAPGSRCRFELHCVGGAVFCETGNHRLPAGMAWLAATQGEQAVFRSVWMSVQPVDERIVAQLLRWRSEGRRLSADISAGRHIFRSERKGRVETFVFDGGLMRPVFDPVDNGMFKRPQPVGRHFAWTAIPDTLLDAWADAAWLDSTEA
ncbi:hypothetical protein D3867_37070 (plasmid) [Azospirillum argentinense]|uniref:Uncharacterized protein n=1 Tax=Azospirillum brasilense TaxID=192 RepID=A0A4D8QKX1_AZOBR|nr:hypothetical protein D3867_37070 [Azospirillum argentinense]